MTSVSRACLTLTTSPGQVHPPSPTTTSTLCVLTSFETHLGHVTGAGAPAVSHHQAVEAVGGIGTLDDSAQLTHTQRGTETTAQGSGSKYVRLVCFHVT